MKINIKMLYGFQVFVLFLITSCVCGDSIYESYVPSRSNGDPTDNRQHHPPSMLCMNIKPQHSVDIKQVRLIFRNKTLSEI